MQPASAQERAITPARAPGRRGHPVAATAAGSDQKARHAAAPPRFSADGAHLDRPTVASPLGLPDGNIPRPHCSTCVRKPPSLCLYSPASPVLAHARSVPLVSHNRRAVAGKWSSSVVPPQGGEAVLPAAAPPLHCRHRHTAQHRPPAAAAAACAHRRLCRRPPPASALQRLCQHLRQSQRCRVQALLRQRAGELRSRGAVVQQAQLLEQRVRKQAGGRRRKVLLGLPVHYVRSLCGGVWVCAWPP